jgi:hypothetical protein
MFPTIEPSRARRGQTINEDSTESEAATGERGQASLVDVSDESDEKKKSSARGGFLSRLGSKNDSQ